MFSITIYNFYSALRTHSANYAVAICPSVCPSHSGILSKRLKIYDRDSFTASAPDPLF